VKLLVTCHRRESWGAGLRAIAEALIELAAGHPLSIDLVLHPNPLVANTMRELLAGRQGIRLLEPLAHADMIAAMRQCDILLSDSGGMQEEAPALGTPLLVLRDKTERPEGVASGNMLLVGTDRRRIVAAVVRLLDPVARAAMSRPAFPFGDGQSAKRIAGHISDFLEGHEPLWDLARCA
jgi:UDP-N-acetylglucosamine 2-epimerase (non-hydrolysing)